MNDHTALSAINPFVVPGYLDAHTRLLCPWTHGNHADLFVDVDHTEANYAAFQRDMDIGALRVHGRLVLVTGPPSSGRSALINRLAHWVVTTLESAGTSAKVLDLCGEIPLERNQQKSTSDRMKHVSQRLCQEIDAKLFVKDDYSELLAKAGDPAMFYPMLAKQLPDDVVLPVILPPMDADTLSSEAERYAGLARRRILFFAECPEITDNQSYELSDFNVPLQPIVVKVGGLKDGDATRFVEDRLNRHRGKGVFPEPEPSSMALLDGEEKLRWTMAALQTVFFRVYARRKDDPNYGVNGDQVPRVEIWNTYFNYMGL